MENFFEKYTPVIKHFFGEAAILSVKYYYKNEKPYKTILSVTIKGDNLSYTEISESYLNYLYDKYQNEVITLKNKKK